jgi:hypothetical protein
LRSLEAIELRLDMRSIADEEGVIAERMESGTSA